MESDKKQTLQYIKYAAINFSFFITVSFSGYITVFLQTVGFNAQQVGLINAVNAGVGIFSSPFWGMISDKLRSYKKVINIALITGAILFALIPWMSGMSIGRVSLLYLFIPIANFFRQPVMSLLDNWMLKNASNEKLNYGLLRSFGALSYALAAIGLGFLIPRTNVELIFYLSVILTIPLILLLLFIKGSADEEAHEKKSLTFKELQIGTLFKNYYFVTYIIFTVFQRIPFFCSFIFIQLNMSHDDI